MCVSEVPQKFSGDSFISLTSLPTCRPLARFPLLASYAFKKPEECCSPLEWKSSAVDCLALISSFEWEREKESLLKLNLARVVPHFCAGIGAWEAITKLRANAFTQLHVSFLHVDHFSLSDRWLGLGGCSTLAWILILAWNWFLQFKPEFFKMCPEEDYNTVDLMIFDVKNSGWN